jgi:hypothetical protein
MGLNILVHSRLGALPMIREPYMCLRHTHVQGDAFSHEIERRRRCAALSWMTALHKFDAPRRTRWHALRQGDVASAKDRGFSQRSQPAGREDGISSLGSLARSCGRFFARQVTKSINSDRSTPQMASPTYLARQSRLITQQKKGRMSPAPSIPQSRSSIGPFR